MMFVLLVTLALGVLLLTMLPALQEWLRPSDVQPLAIDEADALDPPFLARSFAARLAQAMQAGDAWLGSAELVRFRGAGGDAVLLPSDTEREAGVTHRLWYVEGDARLPEGIDFHAEVAAGGAVYTAPHGVYRALWAGSRVHLAAHTSILRWAHGREVVVQADCDLAGRVTADRRVALAPGVRFTLLHAPRVLFLPQRPPAARVPAGALPPTAHAVELQGVRWDSLQQRAQADGSLVVPDDTAWRGDLVCAGDLTLGQRCVVDGSLKARGRLVVGAGCRIRGSVFAELSVQLADDCAVRGVVLSETRIALGRDCVVGTPDALATVTAPHIEVAGGVQVYGTVWAGEHGMCVAGAAPVPAPAPAPPVVPARAAVRRRSRPQRAACKVAP